MNAVALLNGIFDVNGGVECGVFFVLTHIDDSNFGSHFGGLVLMELKLGIGERRLLIEL